MPEYKKIPELYDYDNQKIEEYHSSKMSKKDIAAATLYEALNAADWVQTKQIARQPEKYSEDKFPGSAGIIGKHPSNEKLAAWHLAKAIGQPYIASKLEEPYKTLFQMLSIGIVGNAVRNNKSVGLDVVRW